jgi:hypothetical protein
VPAIVRISIGNIVHLHSVPQEVISDCNVRFTADYWREVGRILPTKLVMSTALHPETDALSQNSHMMVVDYLRGFASHDLTNLDLYPLLAEYAANASMHHLTNQASFELNLSHILTFLL